MATLPDETLSDYAQMLGVLELVPWNGARRRRRGTCLPEVVASLQVRPRERDHGAAGIAVWNSGDYTYIGVCLSQNRIISDTIAPCREGRPWPH